MHERERDRVGSEQPPTNRDELPREGSRQTQRSETSPLARSPYTATASGSTRKRRRIERSADTTTRSGHERTPSPDRTPRARSRSQRIYFDDIQDSENGQTAAIPGSGRGKDKSKGQTSQYTRLEKGKARRVRDDTDEESRDSPGPRDPTKCSWCFTTLSGKTRHQCQACDFNLCSECVINASVVYEEHEGHECQVIPPDGSTAGNTAAASRTSTAPEPTRHLECSVCGMELRGLRWECEQCPSVHLCEDDRRLHIARHSLRAVGSTPAPRPETGDRRPSKTGAETATRREQREPKAWSPPSRPAWRPRSIRHGTTPRIALHGASSKAQGHSGTSASGDRDESEGGVEDLDSEGDIVGRHEGDDGAESVGYVDSAEREDANTDASQRRGTRRRKSARQQQPTHITLTVPIEGYTVFAIWARAILAQAPDMPPPHSRESSESASRVRKHRRWLPEDQERLRELKAEGKTDEQVAQAMGRTAGAVGQQWRKQQL